MAEHTSINPFNGDVVGTVPVTPPEDIADLVARARAARTSWSALGTAARAELLARSAEGFSARAAELGRLITLEMGKPLSEATAEARVISS